MKNSMRIDFKVYKNEKRYVRTDITVTNIDKDVSEKILENIKQIFIEDFNVTFNDTTIKETKDNFYQAMDFFILIFEYGNVDHVKNEIRKFWKEVKKEIKTLKI